MSITLHGGQLEIPYLTVDLPDRDYELLMAHAWLGILKKEHWLPIKWLEPTKQGTRVEFKIPESREEVDSNIAALNKYVVNLNQKYPDVGLEIVNG